MSAGAASSLLAVAAAATAAGLLVPRPPARALVRPRSTSAPGSSGAGAVPAPGPTRARAGSSEGRLLQTVATVAVGAGALLFVGGSAGPVVGALAAAVCWWLTGRLEPPSVRRRREQLAAAVPHAVDLMAACLAAGLSPAAAVEQITAAVPDPLAAELAGLTARLRLGVEPVTVWRDLARHPQLGGLGRAVSRATESGASVADAMQRLAEDVRRRNRAAVESRARAVGVKAAVPLGVCLLPAFVLVGVVPLVAGSVSFLLT